LTRRNPLWRLLALLFALTIIAAACGGDDDDSASGGSTTTTGGSSSGGVKCTDLSLGFFGALTGDAANLGVNIMQGAQLAVNQFNDANPDCQIGFEEYDSQGSPDQAPALAQQAVGDKKVVGLIGPAFSGESRAANPIFDEAGLPIITPSATGVDLSAQGWKIFHRGLANDGAQGPAEAKYIAAEVGAKNVAVIDDASEYGKGLADIVRSSLKDNNATVAVSDSVDPKAQDYSSTVNKVKAANPDAIFYGGYYAEAGRLTKQLRDAGVTATFISGDGTLDPGYVSAAGDAAAEGAIITCPCAPSPDDYKKAYHDAWNEDPGTYSPEAYDAANMFLEAIKAGNTDRASINDWISSNSYEGITKTMKFDDKGEVAAGEIYVYKVQSSKITPAGTVK
jgi:branched-chain amino acid transport system substrate-binding protein